MKRNWKSAVFAALALLAASAFGQAPRSPSTVLMQLGVEGVTSGGGTTNHANRLVKTGSDGKLATSLLPDPEAWLPRFDAMFFIDPIAGDDGGSGAMSAPLATLQAAYDQVAGPATYLLTPGVHELNLDVADGDEAKLPVALCAAAPQYTYVDGAVTLESDWAGTNSVVLSGIHLRTLAQTTANPLAVYLLNGARLDELTTLGAATVHTQPGTQPPAGAYARAYIAGADAVGFAGSALWTNNLYGAAARPATVAAALESLAGQTVVTNGVRLADVLSWNGTRWVPIVGLTNYNTKAEDAGLLAAALVPYLTSGQVHSAFVDDAELAAALANYYTKSAADGLFVTQASVPGLLAPYYTSNQTHTIFLPRTEAAATYVTGGQLTAALVPYAKSADLTATYVDFFDLAATLDQGYYATGVVHGIFVDNAELAAALAAFYDKTASDLRFVDTNELRLALATISGYTNDLVTTAALNSELAKYYTTNSIHALFWTKSQMATGYVSTNMLRLALLNYNTKAEDSALYYPRTQINTQFVSNAVFRAFTSSVPTMAAIDALYVSNSDLADLLEGYYDKVQADDRFVRKSVAATNYWTTNQIGTNFAYKLELSNAVEAIVGSSTLFPTGLTVRGVTLDSAGGQLTRDGVRVWDADDFDPADFVGLAVRTESAIAAAPGDYLIASNLPAMSWLQFLVHATNASMGQAEAIAFDVLWHGPQPSVPLAQVAYHGRQKFPTNAAAILGAAGLRVTTNSAGRGCVWLASGQVANTLTVQAVGYGIGMPELPIAAGAPDAGGIALTYANMSSPHTWNGESELGGGGVGGGNADYLDGLDSYQFLQNPATWALDMANRDITRVRYLTATSVTTSGSATLGTSGGGQTTIRNPVEIFSTLMLLGPVDAYTDITMQDTNLEDVSIVGYRRDNVLNGIDIKQHGSTSNTVWTNWNADMLDGFHGADFMRYSQFTSANYAAMGHIGAKSLTLANHGVAVDTKWTNKFTGETPIIITTNIGLAVGSAWQVAGTPSAPAVFGGGVRFLRAPDAGVGATGTVTYLPGLSAPPANVVGGASVRVVVRAAFPADATVMTIKLGANTVTVAPTNFGGTLAWHEFYIPAAGPSLAEGLVFTVIYPPNDPAPTDVVLQDVRLFRADDTLGASLYMNGGLDIMGEIRAVGWATNYIGDAASDLREDPGNPGFMLSTNWVISNAMAWAEAEMFVVASGAAATQGYATIYLSADQPGVAPIEPLTPYTLSFNYKSVVNGPALGIRAGTNTFTTNMSAGQGAWQTATFTNIFFASTNWDDTRIWIGVTNAAGRTNYLDNFTLHRPAGGNLSISGNATRDGRPFVSLMPAPAANTAFGKAGWVAEDGTNFYWYSATSSRWFRVNADPEW